MKKFRRALTARTAAAAATLIFSLAGTASTVSAAPQPVQTVKQAAAIPTAQANGKNFSVSLTPPGFSAPPPKPRSMAR